MGASRLLAEKHPILSIMDPASTHMLGAIFEVKIHFPPGLVNRHKTINTSNESLETRLDNQLGQVHPFNTYQSAIKLF